MVYRIPEAKPSLKKGSSSVDVSAEKPALAYDPNSDIIMFSEESWLTISASWVKTAVMFLLSAMFIFTVMYATLAATLMFATPIDNKVQILARDTFLGGIPAKDNIVVASPTQAAGKNPLDRLKEAALGVNDAEVVKIVSGPNDNVAVNGDSFAISGQESGSYQGSIANERGEKVTASFQLSNQFIAQCVSGSCVPGSYVTVLDKNIFGEIVNLQGKK